MKTLHTLVAMLALAAPVAAFAQMKPMQDGGMNQPGKKTKTAVHQATGVVKSVDAGSGKVTLEHGPVKSLNWPAMTMAFGVKDKGLLDKLRVGQRVHVDLQEQGGSYVITSVK